MDPQNFGRITDFENTLTQGGGGVGDGKHGNDQVKLNMALPLAMPAPGAQGLHQLTADESELPVPLTAYARSRRPAGGVAPARTPTNRRSDSIDIEQQELPRTGDFQMQAQRNLEAAKMMNDMRSISGAENAMAAAQKMLLNQIACSIHSSASNKNSCGKNSHGDQERGLHLQERGRRVVLVGIHYTTEPHFPQCTLRITHILRQIPSQ